MSRRSGAVSDDAIASEVADAYLLDGGSAIGAAAAGFFAAAGQRPGVLLAPVTVLLAGVGVGARTLDGRLRQPGLGAKRPRGFVEGDPIPAAARVAAPGSVAALLVALAYDDALRLGSVLAPGIKLAKAAGATGRAHLLERIVAVGARALSEGGIARALVAAGGPPEGGTLSAEDLSATHAVDQQAVEATEGSLRTMRAAWADDTATVSGCVWHGICAMDARGLAVGLAYGEAMEGVLVEELELRLARAAIPVRRGVSRTAPGSVLAAPAPLTVGIRSGDPVEVSYLPPPVGEGTPSKQKLGVRRDLRTRRVDVIQG